MDQQILNKAAQQVLCEVLGYDEGRLYYEILSRAKSSNEHSYSKRYRVLKSLFVQGALAKQKSFEKDLYIYTPLPPSFLYTKRINVTIIEALEKLYIENFSDLLETPFSQIILRDETGLVFFLLKYVMKNNANISGTKINSNFLGTRISKVVLNKNSRKDKKLGIIDRTFAFEFSLVRQRDAYDCVGYISTDKNYIAEVERTLNIQHHLRNP